jgi:ABC-type lipoprotein release transport system permease subunit
MWLSGPYGRYAREMDRSLAARRFSAELVGGFAGLAVLLASIGIYGLLAYMVGQRSREIGIRMAPGAQRGDILKLFLRKGARRATKVNPMIAFRES